MAKAAKRESAEAHHESPEKKLRVAKEAPAAELPPAEETKSLSKKEIKALVSERQELDDKVKAMDVRAKIGGKESKKAATERKALASRIMEINADLEANDVVVPRQGLGKIHATESQVPMDDSHEEASMAGEPMAFEHPKPVEFEGEVAEALTERKKDHAKFSKKEMDAHMAKVREIMNRTKKEQIMARINKEQEARKHEKKAKDLKELAKRDARQAERNNAKAEQRLAEAKASQLGKAELNQVEAREEKQEEAVARDMDISVQELRNIEHAFADLQTARVKSGEEKLDFTWEDFMNAPAEPEPPKGFGDRVARLFKKPSSKREAMWKKILQAVNEMGRGQTSLKSRARHQDRPTKK